LYAQLTKEERDSGHPETASCIPRGYHTRMALLETEQAIQYTKYTLEQSLAANLSWSRVSTPVSDDSPLMAGDASDEESVETSAPFASENSIQSLQAANLVRYGVKAFQGIYAECRLLCPAAKQSNTDALYMDTWQWALALDAKSDPLESMSRICKAVYDIIRSAEKAVCDHYALQQVLPSKAVFVDLPELQLAHPNASPDKRRAIVCRKNGAVFLSAKTASLEDRGSPHAGVATQNRCHSTVRLLLWSNVLDQPLEVFSASTAPGHQTLETRYYSSRTQCNEPPNIRGCILYTRLCMLFLHRAHIGEVQVSVWDDAMRNACLQAGVLLL